MNAPTDHELQIIHAAIFAEKKCNFIPTADLTRFFLFGFQFLSSLSLLRPVNILIFRKQEDEPASLATGGFAAVSLLSRRGHKVRTDGALTSGGLVANMAG